VKGLEHIHSKGYAHRDMKLENCLLSENVIKIADFGFLKTDKSLSTQCGTLGYKAPELNQEDLQ
jgi:serine/threonine protein kinase